MSEQKSKGNRNPKWHAKHLADAMKDLTLRFQAVNPQYTVQSDERMIFGFHCLNDGNNQLMEVHVYRIGKDVYSSIYELKMQINLEIQN